MKINELRSIIREVIVEEMTNESVNKKKVAIPEIKRIIAENKLREHEVNEVFGLFKSEERKMLRNLLRMAKEKFYELANLKTSYNHLSCSGTASMMKMRYLVGKSLTYEDGTKVWRNEDFWKVFPELNELT